jgi:hypothetical protein
VRRWLNAMAEWPFGILYSAITSLQAWGSSKPCFLPSTGGMVGHGHRRTAACKPPHTIRMIGILFAQAPNNKAAAPACMVQDWDLVARMGGVDRRITPGTSFPQAP